jgi:D-arabinose 1-dehydrogenase-like Zn-dependent alcohol dehydrogenase
MQGKMEAARFYNVRKPLRIDLIPVPELGVRDVLIDAKPVGSAVWNGR